MHEFLEYRVADAMTYRPVTVTRDTTLAEADDLFARHGFECLPVAEDGVLVGVLSKLDLLRAFAFTTRLVPPYEEIMRTPAREVMSAPAVTVHPDTPLTAVLQMMAETRHRSLPVTIGALLIGILARDDVVRALRRAAAGQRPARAHEPAAITGGRHGRSHLHP